MDKNKKFIRFINKKNITNAVITSVVPKVFLKIKKLFIKKNIKCFELLDAKLKNPIKININKPKQVG